MSRFVRLLLVIVAVAFGIRVAYVAIGKRGPCNVTIAGHVYHAADTKCVRGDELFYSSEADNIAAGHGFTVPLSNFTHPGEKAAPAADHPPLTVLVLAPVSWLVRHPPLSWMIKEPSNAPVREHRYTMVVLGTVLVALIGLLGRKIGGDTVGLVAAGIAAVSPNIWVNDGLIMSETLTTLMVVGALFCALALRDRPTWPRAGALGALCALAGLARVEFLLLLPLLGVVIPLTRRCAWRDRITMAGAAVAACALLLTPWVAFNLSRFQDPTFVSTNDGVTLLGANCDATYYGHALGLWTLDQCIGGGFPAGDESQVSSALRRRAVDYMRDHKLRLPVVMAARVGRVWSVFRPADMVGYNTGEDRERWVTELGLVAFYPTLIAAIAGAIVLSRRRARLVLWVLLAPPIVVTCNALVTYGQTRFRAPAEPSLALLAAVAVVALIDSWRRTDASASTALVEVS